MTIMNKYNLELEQRDVEIAFLHGDLKEIIYMERLEGFMKDKCKGCLLKKYVYGLKQIPMQCQRQFDEFLLKIRFVRSRHDSCV